MLSDLSKYLWPRRQCYQERPAGEGDREKVLAACECGRDHANRMTGIANFMIVMVENPFVGVRPTFW